MKLGASPTPVLAEVIREAMEHRISELNTCMPAVVKKYYPDSQEVDVQPTLKIAYVNDDGTEGADTLPVIQRVPVAFPRAGKFFITMPIQKGDPVLLVFAQRSLDEWSGTSGKVPIDPIDLRMHDISDAVAIPGLYPDTRPLPDSVDSGMAIGKQKGVQIRVTDSDTVEITTLGAETSSAGFVAMANLVQTALDTIQSTFDRHVHLPTAPGSVTGPPIDVGTMLPDLIVTLGPVESTNLKAD